MNIVEVLHRFWMTAEFNYESIGQKQAQISAYDSIDWYIKTGRASYAWETALRRANPKKMLAYIINQDDRSTDGEIKAATAYLKRYCKL